MEKSLYENAISPTLIEAPEFLEIETAGGVTLSESDRLGLLLMMKGYVAGTLSPIDSPVRRADMTKAARILSAIQQQLQDLADLGHLPARNDLAFLRWVSGRLLRYEQTALEQWLSRRPAQGRPSDRAPLHTFTRLLAEIYAAAGGVPATGTGPFFRMLRQAVQFAHERLVPNWREHEVLTSVSDAVLTEAIKNWVPSRTEWQEGRTWHWDEEDDASSREAR